MKELDILLETFLKAHQREIGEGRWPELESFLELEDDLMWDYLRQPELANSPETQDLARMILNSQGKHA